MLRKVSFIMVLVVLSIGISVCQELPDSALAGKRAYIKISGTDTKSKNELGTYLVSGSKVIEFVDSSGSVINQVHLPGENRKEIPFAFNESKRMVNAYTQKIDITLNEEKTFIIVNIIKTEIKEKAFYDTSDYYGIQRVDAAVYDVTGKILFERKDVPYNIVSMSADGSKFCGIVPEPENHSGEVFCPIRDYSGDAQLKTRGKILVLDRQGKVLYQEYAPNAYGIFSPDGNWFLAKRSSYSGTLVNFKTGKRIQLTQNLSDRARREFKVIEPSSIGRIDDEGNILFAASYASKRPYEVFWMLYNPFTDKLKKGNLHRIVE